MKKVFVMFSLFSLFFTVIYPYHGESANLDQPLSIMSISTDTANVYKLPDSSSEIISVLKKEEEFPILSSSNGNSSTITHFVIEGDFLWKIANDYGVTVKDLMKLNHLTNHKIYPGDKLKIPEYYYQIFLLDGKKGWVKKSQVHLKKVKPIVMGWNYGGSTDLYLQQNRISPKLKVVSPRWYTLKDSNYLVSIAVDTRYLKAAQEADQQVWPLLGNRFDPVLTNSIIGNTEKRQKLVAILRKSLVQNKINGINVDFENIDIRNKNDFVSFIRELKQALHPHGIVVSVDVTRESSDPFWSGSYDRRELGKIADYIIMMGYDEHWGGGGKAGSVASLPWVSEGIERLMKDVPSHKIILAVPFYTREWVTNLSTQTVRSYDRTMKDIEKLIASKGLEKVWDEKTSQFYLEFTKNEEKHQIWVEDKISMEHRLNLVYKYSLGGIAAWSIGSETSDVWELF